MTGPRITYDFLDKCDDAYRAEYGRWSWRRKPENSGFELVRNTSPQGDIIDSVYQQVTNLTKRECKDKHDAESWLNTYRGRAAIEAVLAVIAERTLNSAAQRGRKAKRDPLRNNPIVGFMSEEQAERILAEMRSERS